MVTDFSDDATKTGHLSPWNICKAYALHTALETIRNRLGRHPYELLGQRAHAWIAQQVTVKGGGCPTERAVQKAIQRCQDEGWRPGLSETRAGGRPPVYSALQKKKMAEAAMSLKRKIIRPTPAKVRAKIPRTCLNPSTSQPVSDYTIYSVFKTMCYDADEDDPWQYLSTATKDYLPEIMKPKRVTMAQYVLDHMSGMACSNHVAIDPCSSLLPTSATRCEEQRVAAMGSKRFMSSKSRYDGVNLRGSAYAKKQAGRDVLQLHWTPIYAKGRLRIYVCNPAAAKRDANLPSKLNDSEELAKFVKNVLPLELKAMGDNYKWPTLPRIVVHDKASYMVNSKAEKVNRNFEDALRCVGMRSWATGSDGSTKWMASRFSDVYLHETVIAHIRWCLDHRFPRATPGETYAEFRKRMDKVEQYLNSDDFAARERGGLCALSRDFRERCAAVVRKAGERLSK